jgi:hypothetical protein
MQTRIQLAVTLSASLSMAYYPNDFFSIAAPRRIEVRHLFRLSQPEVSA